MKLIVGLGNPDKKYEKTRHNLGFVIIDKLVLKLGLDEKEFNLNKKFNSLILKTKINSSSVILAKPQTFMNNSGNAVSAIASYYKIKSNDIIVIQDEIDLPLGKLRISKDASAAGHNGVQSIINSLGTRDFVRVRIGIRHNLARINKDKKFSSQPETTFEPADLANFVLKKISKAEQKILADVISNAVEAILLILNDELEMAMNKFN